ncbi:clavesin-1-like [Ostrinia furnacalis]|uniref:clavesin-1-like n=1 Tax=Ostrinia furnacalis TaxID=93504 RepID=UPI00103DEBF0|nr:clavesin-1-like [Ostrinia furnacalis]
MSSPTKVSEFPLDEEYNKKTMISMADIKKFRDWLDTQPHLPADSITDLDLILTYHCCDRSTGVAKEVLDLNLTLKTLFINFFKDRVVDDRILNTLNTVLLLPLEVRTHDGSAVLYARLIDYDYKNFTFSDAIRAVLMVVDLWQYEEGTWPGFVIVIDLDRMTLGHLTKLDIQTVQQFLYYLQEAMLVKLKGLHFLNAPSFMDRLMMLLRPFLKKALLDVLHIHQIGSKTVDPYVPMEGLPKDAGGEFKSFEQGQNDTKARFKANQDFFVQENKKRVVEARRPGKPKTISDIFGSVEGSFKKLDID